MLTELQDTAEDIFHDVFQHWRLEHEDGQFLTLETRSHANLHGTACQHLGNAEWTVDTETGCNSLTIKRKVLGEGKGSLAAWARSNAVQVSLCKHCLRDGLVDEHDLQPAEQVVSTDASQPCLPTEALEGQLREATALQYGRNAALRAAALERARGCCEGCGVNFGALFNGLGARALQVHHKFPVAQRTELSITRVEDLAVLCANCHCLVHARTASPMPVDELRRMYSAK